MLKNRVGSIFDSQFNSLQFRINVALSANTSGPRHSDNAAVAETEKFSVISMLYARSRIGHILRHDGLSREIIEGRMTV